MIDGGDNVGDLQLLHFIISSISKRYILTKEYIFHYPHKFIAFGIINAVHEPYSSNTMLLYGNLLASFLLLDRNLFVSYFVYILLNQILEILLDC